MDHVEGGFDLKASDRSEGNNRDNTSREVVQGLGFEAAGVQENPSSSSFVVEAGDPSVDACLYSADVVCSDSEYVECEVYTPASEQEILFQYDPDAVAVFPSSDEGPGVTADGAGVAFPDRSYIPVGDGSQNSYDVRLAWLVMESGSYNFEGLRIPVRSNWNTELLAQLLMGYEDAAVVDFLRYGWPVDRDPGCPIPDSWCDNHKGARDYPDVIDEFVHDGIREGYISGPHDSSPFGGLFITSPLNSCSKRSSSQRRILMDLSWPHDGSSVNAGLSRSWYLGDPVELRYPTVKTMVERIKSLGRGCLMFKRDLSKSFYQLPLCPSAYRLIGFIWRGKFYFKKVMPMGLTTACLAMQRTTLAIRHILNCAGYFLCPYIDDLGGCEEQHKAHMAYQCLGRVLRDVGAKESPEKAVPPTTCMEFLGNNLNSEDLTISVTPERLQELDVQLSEWQERLFVSRRQLESIIGKLQFCCNCVRSGRLFLNRLLNFLRRMERGPKYRVPTQARADLLWWKWYLPEFPSCSLMWLEQFQEPDAVVASDACLIGAGAVWFQGEQFYRCSFPDSIKDGSSICVLELWALILTLKVWHSELRNKAVVVNCDNQAVVELINSGRARDLKMQQGLREVCYLAATGGFEIFASHILGVDNRIPDLLSRWDLGHQYRQQFRDLKLGFTRRPVRRSLFEFSHPW